MKKKEERERNVIELAPSQRQIGRNLDKYKQTWLQGFNIAGAWEFLNTMFPCSFLHSQHQ